jgi:hypothetical protein
VLDALNSTKDGLGPLRKVLQETLLYKDGNHLLWLPDAHKRKREAERCLDYLRLLVKEKDTLAKEQETDRTCRLERVRQQKGAAAFQEKLTHVCQRFIGCYQNPDRQERGYALEDILYDSFTLFDLNPRGPFRRTGEQIDGAFMHDGDHFLLEAKWQTKPVNLADLRDLDGAVGSSLDNTLGLFVSLNGFSGDALSGYSQGNRPRIICMDGGDLMAVLEGRMDFVDLLRRKRDLAVQKRLIFVRVSDILKGIG